MGVHGECSYIWEGPRGERGHLKDEFFVDGEELVFLGVDVVQHRVNDQKNQHRHNGDVIVGLKRDDGYTCQCKYSDTIKRTNKQHNKTSKTAWKSNNVRGMVD